jgi:hypothetical protein
MSSPKAAHKKETKKNGIRAVLQLFYSGCFVILAMFACIMSEDVRFAHTSDMFRSRETLYKVVKHMFVFIFTNDFSFPWWI